MDFLSNACNLWTKSSVFMFFQSHWNYLVSFSDKQYYCSFWNMIWVYHSDIIPGDLASNIWRYNAYKTSYIRKERRAKITERRRNGDWMALKGYWMVTEMYLPFSRLNHVTERRVNGAFQFSRNGGVSSCDFSYYVLTWTLQVSVYILRYEITSWL